MRTTFTSVIKSRSFKMRAWIWGGVLCTLGSLCIVGALLWCSGHHVVKTSKGRVVVEKRFIGLSQTFVDIRGWKHEDVVAHPEVSQALIRAGYEDLLPRKPTFMEQAIAKTMELKEDVVRKGTNAWNTVKRKVEEVYTNCHPVATGN